MSLSTYKEINERIRQTINEKPQYWDDDTCHVECKVNKKRASVLWDVIFSLRRGDGKGKYSNRVLEEALILLEEDRIRQSRMYRQGGNMITSHYWGGKIKSSTTAESLNYHVERSQADTQIVKEEILQNEKNGENEKITTKGAHKREHHAQVS